MEDVLLPAFRFARAHLGRVLVLGLGKSGIAAVEYCAPLIGSRVDAITVYAGHRNDDADAVVARFPDVTFVFDNEAVTGSFDVCITSPGISEFSDFRKSADAASAETLSEVEFAWRESALDSKWVAITGTNGKTTTTACCAHILTHCGFPAVAVGNIGDTCLGAVAADPGRVFVAETSSYQLAGTSRFAPDVAVLLNITPDHLSWHRSHENYVAAKLRILANLDARTGVAVLDATCDTVRETVRALHARRDAGDAPRYVPLGTADGLSGDMRARCGSANAAFLRDDGMLVVALDGSEHSLCTADDLLIRGRHNAADALAAATAAIALGADADDVACALRTFQALEHRIEPCGTVDGVACYNDSKATNVDATLKALAAFEPARPVVLLGGDDKGTDLSELVSAAVAHCAAVVCFGASRQRFLAAFDGAALPVYRADHLEDALDEGLSHCAPGDILVLSPACASFDEFTSFEDRGRRFKDMVARRAVSGDDR